MRALVLGGSVFVGKHTVEALLAGGHDVAVLNRGRTPTDLPEHVERLVADRTDLDQMRGVLEGRDWDAVFDVSGFVMAAGGSDIEGLLDLVDGHIGHYVYVSSIMAYDQSLVGLFPWTEDLPANPDGPGSYGGFKAVAEAGMLARHRSSGFPVSIVRPAAIYGPDNNIFDMELPMFLRLLEHRPIVVPHGGLVVGSYGHVDDLCEVMVTMVGNPAAVGEVFNITGESVTVNRYIDVLAGVVGEDPDVVYLPDSMLDDLPKGVFGHLFGVRHHAMASIEKAQHRLGFTCRYDMGSGHEHTYDWFRSKGYADVVGPMVDPMWKASWDFAAEAAVARQVRGA
jgi:nucleoside-diphosphate-sugar epimerase